MNRRQWIGRSLVAMAGASAVGTLLSCSDKKATRRECEFKAPASLPALKSRRVDALDDMLAPLALSTMSLPKSGEKMDTALGKPIIQAALKAGVTLFDTAWAYCDGDGERLLGEALEGADRSLYRLSTSMPTWSVASAADAVTIFRRQLELLHADRIDYYSLQTIGDREKYEEVYIKGGVLKYLTQQKREGRIRHLGVDFTGDSELLAELLDSHRFDFFRMPYNSLDDMLTQEAMSDAIATVTDEGLAVMVTNPTKDGLLRSPGGDATDILYAADPKMPAVGWALRAAALYTGAAAVIDSVANIPQLAEDIVPMAGKIEMSDQELERWSTALISYAKNRKINCVDCGSCMPCPYGIDIPKNFLINNRLIEDDLFPNAYGDTQSEAFRTRGEALKRELRKLPQRASAFYCIGCGQCLTRCPQGIAIPSQMAHLSQVIEAVQESSARKLSEK